jgi:hypothetical protein
MLAEIFMLRVETATRKAAKDAVRFVPITLPAARTEDDAPLELVAATRAREAKPRA